MAEYVKYKDDILAVILRRGFSKKGANFFTSPADCLQFGVLEYEKGKDILPHEHIRVKREIDLVYEALFIQEGKVEVNFYNRDKQKVDSRILNAGDIILLKNFGHGFKLLEDSKIIEIKQGPYLGKESDKKYL